MSGQSFQCRVMLEGQCNPKGTRALGPGPYPKNSVRRVEGLVGRVMLEGQCNPNKHDFVGPELSV